MSRRVESLDLLRGLCAIGVAAYHMLSWLKIATPHTRGLYGVYLFFIISGVSMTVAYGDRFESGYSVLRYLALRYARLAPLFSLVALWSLQRLLRSGEGGEHLVAKFLFNCSMLFGFSNPGQMSMVNGGWSLGIEFVFYLIFPVLLPIVKSRAGSWVVGGGLALQVLFINVVLVGDLEKSWVLYTQFASFGGYFLVGMWVGLAASKPNRRVISSVGWLFWGVLLCLLAFGSAETAIETLRGGRGVVLLGVACVLVALTAQLDVALRFKRVAGALGDASYAMYLLHPVVFSSAMSPRLFKDVAIACPAAFVAATLAVSFVLATLVYRAFERPVLKKLRTTIECAI